MIAKIKVLNFNVKLFITVKLEHYPRYSGDHNKKLKISPNLETYKIYYEKFSEHYSRAYILQKCYEI